MALKLASALYRARTFALPATRLLHARAAALPRTQLTPPFPAVVFASEPSVLKPRGIHSTPQSDAYTMPGTIYDFTVTV